MRPSSTPFVKICGLSRLADLRAAERLGAAYVGLIVEVGRSPRSVTRHQARLLARAARALPVMVTTCEDPDRIAELARFVQPGVVQLHSFRPGLLRSVAGLAPNIECWQVVSVEAEEGFDPAAPRALLGEAIAAGADKVLLDASRGGESGGTGLTLDWDLAASLVAAAGDTPVILAGGLDPGNVGEAIRRVRPAGVDVSSGVEVAGNTKSLALIRSFFQAVGEVTAGEGTAKTDATHLG